MKKLTDKEMKFANLCVELGNQTEAYRQSYNVTNKDAEWIKVKASQLAAKDNIRLTIEQLREELRESNKVTKGLDYPKA